jgi:hypothetical protein
MGLQLVIPYSNNLFKAYCLYSNHSYEILGAGMLWKPKEARILTNFIDQPVNIR